MMTKEELNHEIVKQIHRPRTIEKATPFNNSRAKGLSTTLAEFIPTEDQAWDKVRAAHAIRRLKFGLHYSEIEPALAQSPTAFIDSVIDDAVNAAMPEVPEWADRTPPPWGSSDNEVLEYFGDNYDLYIGYQTSWTDLMKEHPFREKMVLFWHNHFVTEVGKYEHAPLAYQHFTMLRTFALGNFKDFVHAVGLDSAMLIYLDGIENVKGEPQENYARELLELFTMGIGNYTQNDIAEIARSLTGYYFNYFDLETDFSILRHDTGDKSFFGRTGKFKYDDVIDIIFEEKAEEIAHFICTKLYKYFVYETPNETIIAELAQVFLDENFEIEPVIRMLLKSEHFFDESILGAMIKSPIELMLGMQQEVDANIPDNLREWQPYQLLNLGQFLMNPINVAGWPAYRSWISTTTLPYRWQYSEIHIYSENIDAIEIANAMSEPNDPYQLANDLAQYMLSVTLPQQELDALPTVLLGGIPDYEWNVNASGAKWRILNLMAHIRKLPEYQLL